MDVEYGAGPSSASEHRTSAQGDARVSFQQVDLHIDFLSPLPRNLGVDLHSLELL